jgi:hypothetical protein
MPRMSALGGSRAAPTLLMLFGAFAGAQTPAPAPRTGAIAGQVVDAATGKPVGAVIVSISGPGITMRVMSGEGRGSLGSGVNPSVPRVMTGADGRFMFRDLQAGSFTITASKNGYSDGASGRRRHGGTPQPVVITNAQPSATTSMRIWKNGAIGGTVVDEAGEPVVGLQLRALMRTTTGGRRRFVPAGTAATSDDRGNYRFSGLVPGEYLVIASPPPVGMRLSVFGDIGRGGRGAGELASMIAVGGTQGALQVGDAVLTLGRGSAIPPPPVGDRLQIYPTTFHPSALVPAQAATVTIASGEERAAVDVQLQPVLTARVSGLVTSPMGPAAMMPLALVPQGGDELPSNLLGGGTVTDATGAFTFPAVPPGQYSVRAAGPVRTGNELSSKGGSYWTAMPVTVSGTDLDGLVMDLRELLRISGRAEFQGSNPPQLTAVRGMGIGVTLESLDGPFAAVPGGASGSGGATWDGSTFTLFGYTGGRYVVRVANSPAGWMFKSAMLDGRDVSEAPFDFQRDAADLVITFTDRWSGISGSVQGAGSDGASVVVFPIDAQSWANYGSNPRRLKSARATAQGRFGISSLPPGDYYAVAIPEEHTADWRDPKLLEELARVATRISIGEGEHRTIDLTVKEVRQ